MKTIFNTKLVDNKTQPLFLGQDLSLQRYDNPKYPVFMDLYEKQNSLFWMPNEFALTKDREDFRKLTTEAQFIFTSNLKFQTLMDSIIARGVPFLLEHVTNTELEACLTVWSFFEVIHSRSYSYIIENIYPDSKKIFDEILSDKAILKRAKTAADSYDKLKFGDRNLKEQILLTIANIYAQEGIRFYASFVCSFAFAENKSMQGNAKIISKIRADESQHIFIDQNMLNILATKDEEGFVPTFNRLKDEILQIFLDTCQEEKEWASHLFKDGAIIGLNEHILHEYIEFITDVRINAVGFDKVFNTKNPIKGWIDNWMNPSSVQLAPQETELDNAYLIGSSKSGFDDLNLDFMK